MKDQKSGLSSVDKETLEKIKVEFAQENPVREGSAFPEEDRKLRREELQGKRPPLAGSVFIGKKGSPELEKAKETAERKLLIETVAARIGEYIKAHERTVVTGDEITAAKRNAERMLEEINKERTETKQRKVGQDEWSEVIAGFPQYYGTGKFGLVRQNSTGEGYILYWATNVAADTRSSVHESEISVDGIEGLEKVLSLSTAEISALKKSVAPGGNHAVDKLDLLIALSGVGIRTNGRSDSYLVGDRYRGITIEEVVEEIRKRIADPERIRRAILEKAPE